MRKVLFAILLWGTALAVNSQVIFYVQQPPALEGSYDLTWADPGGGDWTTPDLTDPANAVTGTLIFADDSLGCTPLTNAPQVAGKIAVIYRGTCEFSAKALTAQNAGAIAVIIINNIPGSPVAMGGGASGLNVTIPVIMISDIAGAQLRADIEAGNVIGFIGSKNGFYTDDIGMLPSDIILPPASSNIAALSQDASEFNVALGSWVFNYGSEDQTNVTLNATILYNGSVIYNQTSTPVTVPSGDSTFITLPVFSQATYPTGLYKVQYEAESDSTDEFPSDNMLPANFVISDDIFAYAVIDTTTLMPLTEASYQPANMAGEFETCVHFRNDNASRMAVDGLYLSATAVTGDSLDNRSIEIVAYRWENEFVDLNDAAFAFDQLTDLMYGSYNFGPDEDGETVFVPFDQPIVLEDSTRFLFCVSSLDPDIFIGYSSSADYDEHLNNYLQPVSPINNDGSWFALGFGTDLAPAIGVHMVEASLGNDEIGDNQIVPYPNPASYTLNIPLQDICGKIRVDVLDLNGKQVMTQQANMETPGLLSVNVGALTNGRYIFRMTTEDFGVRTFNVVVNK